jgi:hypothetical protein
VGFGYKSDLTKNKLNSNFDESECFLLTLED